jgi:hypothetical protein
MDLEERGGMIWTGLIWLGLGPVSDSCAHGDESSGSIKAWYLLSS